MPIRPKVIEPEFKQSSKMCLDLAKNKKKSVRFLFQLSTQLDIHQLIVLAIKRSVEGFCSREQQQKSYFSNLCCDRVSTFLSSWRSSAGLEPSFERMQRWVARLKMKLFCSLLKWIKCLGSTWKGNSLAVWSIGPLYNVEGVGLNPGSLLRIFNFCA